MSQYMCFPTASYNSAFPIRLNLKPLYNLIFFQLSCNCLWWRFFTNPPSKYSYSGTDQNHEKQRIDTTLERGQWVRPQCQERGTIRDGAFKQKEARWNFTRTKMEWMHRGFVSRELTGAGVWFHSNCVLKIHIDLSIIIFLHQVSVCVPHFSDGITKVNELTTGLLIESSNYWTLWGTNLEVFFPKMASHVFSISSTQCQNRVKMSRWGAVS